MVHIGNWMIERNDPSSPIVALVYTTPSRDIVTFVPVGAVPLAYVTFPLTTRFVPEKSELRSTEIRLCVPSISTINGKVALDGANGSPVAGKATVTT